VTTAEELPIDFGHWLAGFVDGEGSFEIQAKGRGGYFCRFVIGLRADDLPVLEEIQRVTGLGRIDLDRSNARAHPAARWKVCRKADLAELVRYFERFPLRAKKRRDFELWREAVAQWLPATNGRSHDWSGIALVASALRNGRRYDAALTL
jgi:hypothetical protein